MHYRPLLAIALLVTFTVSGFGSPPSERRKHLNELRSHEFEHLHLSQLDRAYLDTYAILNRDNQCESFFAGRGSRLVLDELVIKLQEQMITDSRIGIRMSGTFIVTIEPLEGLSYRLFERAELNSRGAFYRAKTFPSEPYVPNMGSFLPNTREARAMILLHELAHMIKGKNGTWLIPDDGNSAQLSRQNTQLVESRCGDQIRAL
jgi:hypothetical protein